MTTFPGSPRLIKGGLVLVDPASSAVRRVIVLQYNPDSLSRSLQAQGVGGEEADHSEALRLKGPPVETIRLEAELDAADRLEHPDENAGTLQYGIQPDLAALESIVFPTVAQVQAGHRLADTGAIEILPAEAPLTLFVWSRTRVLPVRFTDFSVTEEAFDTQLNPIRARVSLTMRVLTVADLGFRHPGGSLYLGYLRQRERLLKVMRNGDLSQLGIGGIDA